MDKLLTEVRREIIPQIKEAERLYKLTKSKSTLKRIEKLKTQYNNAEAVCFFCGKKLGTYWGLTCKKCKNLLTRKGNINKEVRA